jgi:hypothetical protein
MLRKLLRWEQAVTFILIQDKPVVTQTHYATEAVRKLLVCVGLVMAATTDVCAHKADKAVFHTALQELQLTAAGLLTRGPQLT